MTKVLRYFFLLVSALGATALSTQAAVISHGVPPSSVPDGAVGDPASAPAAPNESPEAQRTFAEPLTAVGRPAPGETRELSLAIAALDRIL